MQHHKVNRFEVIDHRTSETGSFAPNQEPPRGRVYSVRGVKIELSYQDDGKTLKVFVTD